MCTLDARYFIPFPTYHFASCINMGFVYTIPIATGHHRSRVLRICYTVALLFFPFDMDTFLLV